MLAKRMAGGSVTLDLDVIDPDPERRPTLGVAIQEAMEDQAQMPAELLDLGDMGLGTPLIDGAVVGAFMLFQRTTVPCSPGSAASISQSSSGPSSTRQSAILSWSQPR